MRDDVPPRYSPPPGADDVGLTDVTDQGADLPGRHPTTVSVHNQLRVPDETDYVVLGSSPSVPPPQPRPTAGGASPARRPPDRLPASLMYVSMTYLRGSSQANNRHRRLSALPKRRAPGSARAHHSRTWCSAPTALTDPPSRATALHRSLHLSPAKTRRHRSVGHAVRIWSARLDRSSCQPKRRAIAQNS